MDTPAAKNPAQQPSRQQSTKARAARRWLLWAGLVIACTVFALGSVFSWYPSSRLGNGPNWNQALGWELVSWYLWLPLGALAVWLERRFRNQRRQTFHEVLLATASVLSFAAAHTALLVVIYLPLVSVRPATFFRYRSFVLSLDFLGGIVIAGLVIGVVKARNYYLRLREEELKTSHLQAQMAQAQLEALKMQLHPHFLFNTLNAISALQTEDPEAAQRTLTRLADFLRLTLDNAGVQEVALERELDFVMRYLEIERIRFGDRLALHTDIDPATRQAQVPNLILQPLVENAIRHGIAARAGPGRIEISSARNNGALLLSVRDTGPGMPPSPREGIGLANTRARLDRLYGPSSSLRLKNLSEGGFEAAIEMPFIVDQKR